MDSDSGDILVRTTRQTALGLCMLFLIPLLALAITQNSHDGAAPTESSNRTAGPSGIDPNTAEWYELAQLPGIGETVARRIVAYRSDHDSDADGVVFHSAADLDNVRGIGRRTLDRIAPFLTFSTPSSLPQS